MTTKVPVELSSTPGIVDGSNATAITIDSSEDVTLAGHLVFADSKNAKFGAGSDLQIYHDGSDSYIKDSGTGNLLIQGSDIYFGDASGNHLMRLSSAGGLSVGTTTDAGAGKILANGGVYISAFDGDKLITDGSQGGGSDALFIGNAQISVSSDERIKKDVVDTAINATEKLKKVRVVDFTWDDPKDQCYNNKNARGKWTGAIAQEIISVFPHIINAPRNKDTLEVDNDSDRKWLVEYQNLVPVLIKSIQELEARLKTLEDA